MACTGSFFVSVCLLLHPRPISIRSWLQHALKKASKPSGNLVVLLDDVLTNPWKHDAAFTSLSTGIEVTTEVRDDLMKGKSNGKQAAIDFVVKRCSSNPVLFRLLQITSNPTLDYFKLPQITSDYFQSHFRLLPIPLHITSDYFQSHFRLLEITLIQAEVF